jgi:hypothetical protein
VSALTAIDKCLGCPVADCFKNADVTCETDTLSRQLGSPCSVCASYGDELCERDPALEVLVLEVVWLAVGGALSRLERVSPSTFRPVSTAVLCTVRFSMHSTRVRRFTTESSSCPGPPTRIRSASARRCVLSAYLSAWLQPQLDADVSPTVEQTQPSSALRHIRRDSLELGRILAKGGFGVVYEAEHHSARVVVKVLQDRTEEVYQRLRCVNVVLSAISLTFATNCVKGRAEFEEEIRITVAVGDHPNLVRVIGVGEDGDNNKFIVLDRTDGRCDCVWELNRRARVLAFDVSRTNGLTVWRI